MTPTDMGRVFAALSDGGLTPGKGYTYARLYEAMGAVIEGKDLAIYLPHGFQQSGYVMDKLRDIAYLTGWVFIRGRQDNGLLVREGVPGYRQVYLYSNCIRSPVSGLDRRTTFFVNVG